MAPPTPSDQQLSQRAKLLVAAGVPADVACGAARLERVLLERFGKIPEEALGGATEHDVAAAARVKAFSVHVLHRDLRRAYGSPRGALLVGVASHEVLTPEQALVDVFGFDAFREPQGDVVRSALAGEDELVVMPTGKGKSACFQIPAIVDQAAGRGVTVVVSPLVALMRDQVRGLKSLGVEAAALSSGVDTTSVMSRAFAGEISLLYLAPERLSDVQLLEDLAALQLAGRLARLVVDEAHCISQWGRGFRPEYRMLQVVRRRLAGLPCMALTATADERTRADIISVLDMQDARIFVESFDRPNIRYAVDVSTEPLEQLLAFIQGKHRGEVGIVYCRTRDQVEEVAAALREQEIRALPFHAGLPAATRRHCIDAFTRDDALVVVATIAFGMGIDRAHVRFVAHLSVPASIEDYYQQTGRAGRDGEPADAWLLLNDEDVRMQRRLVSSKANSREERAASFARFEALRGVVTSARCRRQLLLEHFGEASSPCDNCDNCLQIPPVQALRPEAPPSEDAAELIDKLRSLRQSVALELGVPAGVILSNRTIAAIAANQPTSIGELAEIKGMGPARTEQLGSQICALVCNEDQVAYA